MPLPKDVYLRKVRQLHNVMGDRYIRPVSDQQRSYEELNTRFHEVNEHLRFLSGKSSLKDIVSSKEVVSEYRGQTVTARHFRHICEAIANHPAGKLKDILDDDGMRAWFANVRTEITFR